MNLSLILGCFIFWSCSLTFASYKAYNFGQERKADEIAALNKRIDETYDKALAGASKAISAIEVKNVTITRQLETQVRTIPVFSDCHSGADSMRLYNSGIDASPESAPPVSMPTTPTPTR